MKISYNWLRQFLKIELPIDQISEMLTDLGLEVEGTHTYESLPGGLAGVVVGEVMACEPHPNADRLKVTQVKLNDQTTVQIVCGAPNVAVGQKVPVATEGTTLYPKEGEAFEIKKSKIRGEESRGMICAEDELGLGTDHDGIMVLEKTLTIGTPCSEVFNIETDTVFEIGLTPNRADAMSHLGVARDLKAACILKKIPFEWNTPTVSGFSVNHASKIIPVNVKDTERAPQYYGLTLSDLKIKPSPQWLQNRLKAIGIGPKNNVVDATNYVLHELGQPLHAFDADKIKGGIVVQTCKAGTPFTTLDGVERKLDAEDLMICDHEKPHCLAGVFGGNESGVSENTTSIFLESAYFNPVSIRKSAKRHGLNTDASFRFERGIDPEIGEYALKRAALLILQLAGGSITSEIEAATKPLVDPAQIVLSFEQLNNIVGQSLELDVLQTILTALEFNIIHASEEAFALEVPRFRVDVTRPADVIEEILRVYGYNNLLSKPLRYVADPEYNWKSKHRINVKIANQLSGLGFLETLTNSLTSPDYIADFKSPVQLINPLGKEVSQLRQSLLFNALETIAFNCNRQQKALKLFEFGKIYGREADVFSEEERLGLSIVGAVFPENWDRPHAQSPFFYGKGLVTNAIESLGFNNLHWEADSHPHYEDGLALYARKTKLGVFGSVSADLLQSFGIDQAVYYADLDWDTIVRQAYSRPLVYEEIAKFPSARRDFALLLDREVSFEQITTIAHKTENKILQNIDLFDVYEGKNLPEGKKSYGVSFIFQDAHKTLTDSQVDKVMQRLQKNFEAQLGAQLR